MKNSGGISKYGGLFAGMVDAIYLGLIWLLCCLPIITAGPATTALYYTMVKSVRRERGGATKNFFRAFKENFFQSFVIWLIILLYLFVWSLNLYAVTLLGLSATSFMGILAMAMIVPLLLPLLWIFPCVSRFENSVMGTIKFAAFVSVKAIFQTISLFVILAAGIGVAAMAPALLPILPGPVCLLMTYQIEPVFKTFTEDMESDENSDQWYND